MSKESSVIIEPKALELWRNMYDDSTVEKANWIALLYEEDDKLVLSQSGNNGIDEASKALKEQIMILIVRGVHMKVEEILPIDVIVLYIPESFTGFRRAKTAFHLEFVCKTLELKDFCLIEASTPDDVSEKKVLERVIKITGDPTGRYMFDDTVSDMRRRVFRSKGGVRLPLEVRARQINAFAMRTLFSSQLMKEGGGRFSYSIKSRYHVLTADMKMKYMDKKGGKLKGTYSVMLAKVGLGIAKKKKKGFAKFMAKGKKKLVEGGQWFYIETVRRTYHLYAPTEKISLSWLEVLEMMGCRRKDIKNSEGEEETEGEDDARSHTTDKMLEISQTVESETLRARANTVTLTKPDGTVVLEDPAEIAIKKALELKKFAEAAEGNNVEGMKNVLKVGIVGVNDIVQNRRSSIALVETMRRLSTRIHLHIGNGSVQGGKKEEEEEEVKKSKEEEEEEDGNVGEFHCDPFNIDEKNRESFEGHGSIISELLNMGRDNSSSSRSRKGTEGGEVEAWGFSTMQYIMVGSMSQEYKEELLEQLIIFSRGKLGKPLLEACYNNYAMIIKKLVNSGANVNCQDPQTGDTPLTNLAKSFGGDPFEIVKFLLQKGADPNLVNKKGENFLSIAKFDTSKDKSLMCIRKHLGEEEEE